LAQSLLQHLYKQTLHNKELTPSHIHFYLQKYESQSPLTAPSATEQELPNKLTMVQTPKGAIKARTPNQALYLQHIQQFDLNLGIGPAGTGKTFLAVACAVAALEAEQISRIILVRPAVEAGERLGFLPGDLAQKIDPYLRPLFDALYEMLGAEKVTKLIENHVIEIAPLAYMRGRTLNEAFIILDEAQNTTVEQMKMFLTRIGFNAKAIITGDITQIDLPVGQQSGLRQVVKILKNIPGIQFTFFETKDVVRHPLVQRIIEAYEHFETQSACLPQRKGRHDR
jgi:phosphate starvation-inducible PhoH-like protein